MPATAELIEPAYLWVPEHTSTAAGEFADLADAAGIDLDPEQRLALDALLAEKPNGRWAAFESAIIAPRQNIKTHLFKIIALGEVTLLDTDLVMWSAHEFSTAMESMGDLEEIIESTDFLDRRCMKLVHQNGEEGFHFRGPGGRRQRIRFKARTKTGARGLSAPTLLLDEAFALRPAHIGSLMPTMSARSVTGNPHIIYGSSAGRLESDVLRSLRDRGRPGGDPSLTYIEWCDDEPRDACATEGCMHAYGTEGCVLDDEDRWQAANLAKDRRIGTDFIRTERRSMTPEEFACERMGWWIDPATGQSTVSEQLWAACANRKAEVPDPVKLAFDIDHGQMSASILACSGALHVARHQAGTHWLVDGLNDLLEAHQVDAVGVDGSSGPARAFIPVLERPVDDGGCGLEIRSKQNPHGKLVVFDGPEMVDACETFYRDVLEGKLVHRDEQALNTAIEGAGRRQVGDSFRWSRRHSNVPISPLNAATVAWALDQASEDDTDDFAIVV